MTKKRHAKLLRALATKIHVYAMKNLEDYKSPHGKAMYNCVRLAEKGFVTQLPEQQIFTRQDWWNSISKSTLELFGMGDIKEKRERK